MNALARPALRGPLALIVVAILASLQLVWSNHALTSHPESAEALRHCLENGGARQWFGFSTGGNHVALACSEDGKLWVLAFLAIIATGFVIVTAYKRGQGGKDETTQYLEGKGYIEVSRVPHPKARR